MLNDVYLDLYYTLVSILGFQDALPQIVDFWLNGFAILATLFVAVLPFIVVYKVVRWLSA